MSQAAFQIEGKNYVQVRFRGEPEPCFVLVDSGACVGGMFVGEIVSQTGNVIERVQCKRSDVLRATPAVMHDSLGLVPVDPINPVGSARELDG